MNTFEQAIGAGESIIFPGAEQFHLLEADDPIDIAFYSSRNQPLETWEDMKGGFRIVFKEGFIQVKVTSATAQTIKIGLTSGRGEYDRSQGDVSITSGTITEVQKLTQDNSWYYDTEQKRSFIGGGSNSGGAATYAHAQLWNPAASGKRLILQSLQLGTASTTWLWIADSTSALGADGFEGNKYLGEAAPVGQVKHTANATLQGSQRSVAFVDVQGNFPIKPNIIIPEGRGLIIAPGNLNVDLWAQFQWIEVTA